MTGRALVAGVGNIFLGDDGFGVEVAARLAREALPAGVRVLDIGIRARDLAYEVRDGGYDKIILVDALARGGAPGTIYVVEPDVEPPAPAALDGHSITPESALALVQTLGGTTAEIVVIGCEPACVDEGIGLSAAAEAGVEEALRVLRRLLRAGPEPPALLCVEEREKHDA